MRTSRRTFVWSARVAITVGLCCSALSAPLRADPVADFYRGKTLNLVSGFSPNGEYDSELRLIGRHISRHLPGNPQVVSSSMPGAGTMIIANHLYKVAPADGSYVGMFAMQVAVEPFLKNKVAVFDPLKFNWIGTLARNHQYCVVAPGPGVASSMEDLLRREGKETLFGSAGSSSEIHRNTAVLKNVLGARIRLVTGYSGMPPIKLAIARGEINGVCGLTAAALRRQHGPELSSGKLKLILQLSGSAAPEFGNIPRVLDYARDDGRRKLLEYFYGTITLGRPIAVPPGVPAERIAALRGAFAATLADKAFIEEAKRLVIDISPSSGDDLAREMQRLSKLPDAFFDEVRIAHE